MLLTFLSEPIHKLNFKSSATLSRGPSADLERLAACDLCLLAALFSKFQGSEFEVRDGEVSFSGVLERRLRFRGQGSGKSLAKTAKSAHKSLAFCDSALKSTEVPRAQCSYPSCSSRSALADFAAITVGS